MLGFDDDGLIRPNSTCLLESQYRVEKSCELLGLNLPKLITARKRIIRDVAKLADAFRSIAKNRAMARAPRAPETADIIFAQIREKAKSEAPYSRAAIAEINRQGLSDLLVGIT